MTSYSIHYTKLYEAQGGVVPNLNDFIHVDEVMPYKAKKAGYIKQIKALNIGLASMKLGGGRETKEQDIDPNVGIVLHKKVGQCVEVGEVLCDIYRNQKWSDDILGLLDDAYCIVEEVVETPETIKTIIG